MVALKRFLTVLVLLILLTGCKKNGEELPLDGPVLSMSDIAGNWTANTAIFSALELDSDGQPIYFDVIDEGGTFKLNIQTNGRFTSTITIPGEPNSVSNGQLGFDDEFLAIEYDDFPGEYEYYYIELLNQILTLRGETEFDFTDDGLQEPAYLELIMEKA